MKFDFKDYTGAWCSLSGLKWERPLLVETENAYVRLFNDVDDATGVVTTFHDYSIDGKVVAHGKVQLNNPDNLVGEWIDAPKPRKPIMESITEVVEEDTLEQVEDVVKELLYEPIPQYATDPNKAYVGVPLRSASHRRFDQIIDDTINTIRSLSELKGGEYAGDLDRLANFRRNGEVLGVPMETVWAIYANKHHDAVMQYIKDINAGTTRTRSEPISGRVDDLIVYLLLFKLMLEETSGKV